MLGFMEGGKMKSKIGRVVFWAAVLGITGMIASGHVAPPSVVLDSPPNDSTTSNRYMDLVATVTDPEMDPMTVWFYGGSSDPPGDLLYVEEGVSSGSQLTFTWATPVLKVDTNTVALWHFDEAQGDTAYDVSGKANHGIVNGASWTSGGKFGYGLEFDGVDDYVRVLSDSTLDLWDQITVEAWLKGTGAGFTGVQRTASNVGSLPQLQVVGDKIHYVFTNGSQVFTAEMNTDGTGWSHTQRTSGGGGKLHGQFEVTQDTIWYIWRQEAGGYWQEFFGVMNVDGTGWNSTQLTYDASNHY